MCFSYNDTSALDPVELCSTLLAAAKTPQSMVNFSDQFGQTPLHLAARRGAGICTTYLLKVNAKTCHHNGLNENFYRFVLCSRLIKCCNPKEERADELYSAAITVSSKWFGVSE